MAAVTWRELERLLRIAERPLRAQIYVAEMRGHITREDVLQEGRIAAWLALERVPGSLPGYLVIRARGAMVDAMRKASWVPRGAYGEEEQAVMVTADSDDGQPLHPIQPDEAVASIHVRRLVEQLQRLPDQQVLVAGLLADGKTPTEIAAQLGVSVPRVSQIKAELEEWVRRRL